VKWHLPEPFIPQVRVVTTSPNIGDDWGDKQRELPDAHHALRAVGDIEPNQSFHPLTVRCCFRCWGRSRNLSTQGFDDAPRRDVLGISERDMERLAALVVAGLRVGVVIDGLQCPPGILELHLYVFLLLWVHFLFALPLAERCVVLALLLHIVTKLFHELLDLPTFRRGMARGVVHRALHAVVVAIGQLTGAFVASWPPMAPTHRCSCSDGCFG
jgi:hypothetical protein